MEREKRCQTNELLSIIIPVYNVDLYLERCLESVLSQSYKELEVILVDDGSTDQSGDICDKFAKKDGRVNVIHKSNGGLVSARKAGLHASTGKYISYVDSDDWIEQGMYMCMMEKIVGEKADIVSTGILRDYDGYIVEEREKYSGMFQGNALKEIKKHMIATDVFFQSNISIHIYNKIYKREIIEPVQMAISDDISVGEDAMCVYPCILSSNRIVFLEKNFYHYCLRNNSIMGQATHNEEKYINYLCNSLRDLCKRNNDDQINIDMQINVLEKYYKLLRNTENIVSYSDNILIPFGKISNKEKVVVYGNGKFAEQLITLLQKMGWINVVAYATRDNIKQIMNSVDYDKIIIAVLVYEVINDIKQYLFDLGINQSNIISVDITYLNLE